VFFMFITVTRSLCIISSLCVAEDRVFFMFITVTRSLCIISSLCVAEDRDPLGLSAGWSRRCEDATLLSVRKQRHAGQQV